MSFQQYKLQFGVAETVRLAAKAGRTGAAIAHNAIMAPDLRPDVSEFSVHRSLGSSTNRQLIHLRYRGY